MKIGDEVKVCIDGRDPQDGVIKRYSFIPRLVLVNLLDGGWMMVEERDLKEKTK